jgi:hypothetical protein
MSEPANTILTKLVAHVEGELRYYNLVEPDAQGVTDIREHPARGEGDRWFYDVHFSDGHVERCFEPQMAHFAPQDDDLPF